MQQYYKLALSSLLVLSFCLTASAQEDLIPPHFHFEGDVPRDSSIPSPSEFLGYETGAEYTIYADVVRYIHAVAEASDRVTITEYARTYENRSLHALFITTPANHARLDEIRAANLRLADSDLPDSEAQELISGNPIVTWLSYNVHGNEPSSTEAALEVLYRLAAGTDDETLQMLDQTVIVIDPTINPDGRDRYVYWYKSMQSNQLRESSSDAEHDEPFPGGRTNHYWFDLNRDWVWLVHPESRGRIALYQQWLPQVHMDYHEQGFNNNYFTMPGKPPRNLNLPEDYEMWADVFGRASGEALARNQVNYFTRESFEFFYPGYGSSYPSILGSIGMLAEQGGHSRGGRAVKTNDGYVLTLRQRVFDHFSTSLAVVRSAVENRQALLTYFRSFFDPETRDNETNAYLIPDDGGNGYVGDVIDLLLKHGVEIEQTTEAFSIDAYDYWDATSTRRSFGVGTYVIRTNQDRHVLINTLMQRQMEIESLDMYDMSTWSIPLAYNLSGAAWTEQNLRADTSPVHSRPSRETGVVGENARYGYAIDWRQRGAPKALGMLWEAGYNVRSARKTFGMGDEDFSVGTVIVLRGRNRDLQDHLEADMARIARDANVRIVGMDASRMDRGMDLASASARVIKKPNVALMIDSPFSSETAGQLWFMFDRWVEYGVDRIRGRSFPRLDLDEYDVLILPPGNPGTVFDSVQTERLTTWIRKGGTLIGSESAARFLTKGRSGITGIELAKASDAEDSEDDAAENDDIEERFYTRFEDRRDSTNVARISGSAMRAVLDNSHPLAAGMPDHMFSLKFGSDALMPSSSMATVGYYDRDQSTVLASGASSDENKEKLAGKAFAGVQNMGDGKVILLLDKTQYRMFWIGPSRLMLNAVMLMPGM